MRGCIMLHNAGRLMHVDMIQSEGKSLYSWKSHIFCSRFPCFCSY